jgi:Beta-1,3-glucanase
VKARETEWARPRSGDYRLPFCARHSAGKHRYYDSYVSQVRQKYATTPLSVDTQASFGTVTGEVSGGLLTFAGVGSFARPSAADISSSNSGPFSPAGMSAEMLAILPRLAAAFNRSTLLIDASQPDGEDPADYYTNAITNHYARIVHATRAGGRGYAFPYDDVPRPEGPISPARRPIRPLRSP